MKLEQRQILEFSVSVENMGAMMKTKNVLRALRDEVADLKRVIAALRKANG